MLNPGEAEQTVNLDLFGSCVTGFERLTTSETKSSTNDGRVALEDGRVTVTLDPQSVTTFVSLPLGATPPDPPPAVDAGASDAGTNDAGIIDAGVTDAGGP